jgi:hypothetical protein
MGKKLVTANEIYKRFEDVDDALEEIEKEAERRVCEFADWLRDKKHSTELIDSYCNNIFNSQRVITQHEPPWMFLEEVRDDINDKRISKGESYGFLFKYHVFLDAIKETWVDENYVKALKLYFQFLAEKKYLSKVPSVVSEVLGKEDVYLRRLKEYREGGPEGEEKWMGWFKKWCREVFTI